LKKLSPDSNRILAEYLVLLRAVALQAGLVHLSEEQANDQILRSLLVAELLNGYLLPTRGSPAAPTKAGLTRLPPLVVDVGSGAGLPGIPIAVALADSASAKSPAPFKIVLVEPKRKAVAFLEKAVRDLGLEVSVFQGSAQEAAAGPFGKNASFVTAKALAKAQRALELCAPICQPGGKILLTAKSETDPPLRSVDLAGLGIESTELVALSGPSGPTQRVLVAVKK